MFQMYLQTRLQFRDSFVVRFPLQTFAALLASFASFSRYRLTYTPLKLFKICQSNIQFFFRISDNRHFLDEVVVGGFMGVGVAVCIMKMLKSDVFRSTKKFESRFTPTNVSLLVSSAPSQQAEPNIHEQV